MLSLDKASLGGVLLCCPAWGIFLQLLVLSQAAGVLGETQWPGEKSPGGLPWGVGHTWLMLCSLLPGTVWPCASSTAAPASWLALPSSPSWASWHRSRVCPSPRWPSQVSGDPGGMGLWGCCHLSPQQQRDACSCRFPSFALRLQKAGRNECK